MRWLGWAVQAGKLEYHPAGRQQRGHGPLPSLSHNCGGEAATALKAESHHAPPGLLMFSRFPLALPKQQALTVHCGTFPLTACTFFTGVICVHSPFGTPSGQRLSALTHIDACAPKYALT